ncbi:MAG: ClbS/DfsB family four-helix bundle protein [Coriobacteriia bacterium]|nr:ClbS/DfsB family four-helix bundle protein [Coriobacteriia bacterium]
MPRPTTKAAMIDASDAGFRLLLAEVEAIPADLRDEQFPFPGRDRTIRDVVSHLHEWHKLMLGWYKVGMRGEQPAIPAPGFTWRTTPDLNRDLWAVHQSTDLESALALVQETHRQVHGLILNHTDEELFTKRLYRWTGTTSLGAFLVSCTSSHYEWGLKKIRKLRKQLESADG